MTKDRIPDDEVSARSHASQAGPGRLGALRRSSAALIEMLELRLELIANDLELEKLRAVAILTRLLAALALGLASLALLLGALLLAVPEAYRWMAASGAGLVCALVAFWLWRRAVEVVSEGAFVATRAEFRRDREGL
ncbi:MAG TPA: phage holin family protein [Burkholderiaceae bacterium]|jgi:uncharacterized membrane protein YqjE